MFKTDAAEIIEDAVKSIYREGMTTETFKEGVLVKLASLIEAPTEFRVASCQPGDDPGSITVSFECVDYT